MTLFFLGLLVLVLLVFLTNTKRWRAVGRGFRQTRTGFEDELQAREQERDRR